MITNDAIILGLIMAILGIIFSAQQSKNRFLRTVFRYVPSILLCYFLPSILTNSGLVNVENSQLYFVVSRYLLPAGLVLLTINVNLKAISKLGRKSLIMFFVGTFSVVIGGPLALFVVSLFSPDLVIGEHADGLWRGLTTVAGSWIGGGANQVAMREIFNVDSDIFSAMVTMDVVVASLWIGVLLYMSNHSSQRDKRINADILSIEKLTIEVESMQKMHERIPSVTDFISIAAVAFFVTALGHGMADFLAPWFQNNHPKLSQYSFTSHFFWLIVFVTLIALVLSFTRASELVGAGATKIGTVFIYLLVATIGLKMNINGALEYPSIFIIGGLWMVFHAAIMLIVGRLLRAPTFFIAVGSMANIGGAASAPIIAASFHPALAPVGVLLAVLGYVVGTFAAWICSQGLRFVGG